MSQSNANTSPHVTDDAHTGPVRTPEQLLKLVFFSFVLPVAVIVGMVYYVVTDQKPTAGEESPELAIAARIQKVGHFELRDANRKLRTGEEVFKLQCTNCHAAGLVGAPKFGDTAAWSPRIKTGFEALLNSAMKGKNAMPPQSGGNLDAVEVARAVVYMANAAGAKFDEPKAPEPAAATSSVPAPGASAVTRP